MATVVQYVVKPNPGSDLAAILEMTKESAAPAYSNPLRFRR